jgi:hypothetical protein
MTFSLLLSVVIFSLTFLSYKSYLAVCNLKIFYFNHLRMIYDQMELTVLKKTIDLKIEDIQLMKSFKLLLANEDFANKKLIERICEHSPFDELSQNRDIATFIENRINPLLVPFANAFLTNYDILLHYSVLRFNTFFPYITNLYWKIYGKEKKYDFYLKRMSRKRSKSISIRNIIFDLAKEENFLKSSVSMAQNRGFITRNL